MVVVFLGFPSDAGQSRGKEGRVNASESETGKREPCGEAKHPKPWAPVLLSWSLWISNFRPSNPIINGKNGDPSSQILQTYFLLITKRGKLLTPFQLYLHGLPCSFGRIGMCQCGGLRVNGSHRPTGSGTNRRSGFVGVDVAL